MRIIGQIQNEAGASTFSDYLYVLGIKNEIEAKPEGGWAVWVYAEDELERARGLLDRYLENPSDPQVRQAALEARKRREKEDQEGDAALKKVYDRSRLLPRLASYGVGRLTLLLIGACVIVTLLSAWGENKAPIMGLFITKYMVGGSVLDKLAGLSEIRHGQIWRLVTPILIHFGPLHLLFNMLWLYDLGSMIEQRQRMGRLALMVLVIAVVSNLGQYLATGPNFGGMSGVVYGLLGYIWMRGRFDPTSGLFLHPQTVAMMLIWYFLCLTGLLGSVANVVHTLGLIIGMGWGYLSATGLGMFNRR